MRWEIVRIECRNNQARRITTAHNGIGMTLADVSARFLLQRHRVCETGVTHGSSSAGTQPPTGSNVGSRRRLGCRRRMRKKHQNAPINVRKKRRCGKSGKVLPPQKCGGGGAFRSFCSKFFRSYHAAAADRKAMDSMCSEAAKAYMKVMVEGGQVWDELVELGRAASLAHAHCGRSFGRRSRKRRAAGEADGHVDKRVTTGLDDVHAMAVCVRQTLQDWDEEALKRDKQETTRAAKEIYAHSEANLQKSTDLVLAGHSAAGGVASRLFSPSSHSEQFKMEFLPVVLPALEMAKRRANTVRSGQDPEQSRFQDKLAQAWESAHRVISHKPSSFSKALPADRKSLSQFTVCFRVGRCICDDPRRQMREHLVKALRSMLKTVKKKSSTGRKIYDGNRLVMHIKSHSGRRAHHVSSYWMVGFGNLTDGNYTVVPLEFAADSADLHCAVLSSASGFIMVPSGKPKDFFAAVESLPLHRQVVCDLHELVLDAPEPMPHFFPVAVISDAVKDSMTFWSPQQKGKAAVLAIVDQPDPEPLAEADAELEVPPGEGDAGILEVTQNKQQQQQHQKT